MVGAHRGRGSSAVKVLHLVKTLLVGGAEVHLLHLCRALRRLGVEVVVAHLEETAGWGTRSLLPDFEGAGIRVVDLHMRGLFDPGAVLRLRRLLVKERPAVLHTHLPRTDFVGAVGRALHPSTPLVASVHDVYDGHWPRPWQSWVSGKVWRRADAVIAISQRVSDWLVGTMGIDPSRIRVVRYGIDFERFERASTPADGDGAGAGRVVGSIARLEPRKGHDVLIRAMPAVLQAVPEALLVIAGNDPLGYGRELETIIRANGVAQHVKLVGYQDDVPGFLRGLAVFAFASRAEGFGQVVVEAMAAGRPVVASGIAPITEIVADGETGMLASPDRPEEFARAIVALLRDPAMARGMGERGLDRVRTKFTVDRMARETLAVYESVARAA
jgi:glycosyltransferase involved in cell wall biosynthesis